MASTLRFQVHHWLLLLAAASLANPGAPPARAEQNLGATREVLTAAEAAQVDQAVDTALEWLAQQQQPDGGFPGRATGQPGITSLTVLAFLSAGHLPGSEPYANISNGRSTTS